MYIWEQSDWPEFVWEQERVSKLLMHAHREQGRLQGKMEALGFDLRAEAYLRTLTKNVVKSSEIEGERLDNDQVRSSIARRLGMDVAGLVRRLRALTSCTLLTHVTQGESRVDAVLNEPSGN